MEKVIRISTTNIHERSRIDDVRKCSPDERVLMLLKMQSEFYQWDVNTKIKRVANIRKTR